MAPLPWPCADSKVRAKAASSEPEDEDEEASPMNCVAESGRRGPVCGVRVRGDVSEKNE